VKGKVYFSRKFYEREPLKSLPPEVELSALNSLKDSLLRREEYEKVQLVQNCINEIMEEIRMARFSNLRDSFTAS
jgi:hypothetical protein